MAINIKIDFQFFLITIINKGYFSSISNVSKSLKRIVLKNAIADFQFFLITVINKEHLHLFLMFVIIWGTSFLRWWSNIIFKIITTLSMHIIEFVCRGRNRKSFLRWWGNIIFNVITTQNMHIIKFVSKGRNRNIFFIYNWWIFCYSFIFIQSITLKMNEVVM